MDALKLYSKKTKHPYEGRDRKCETGREEWAEKYL